MDQMQPRPKGATHRWFSDTFYKKTTKGWMFYDDDGEKPGWVKSMNEEQWFADEQADGFLVEL